MVSIDDLRYEATDTHDREHDIDCDDYDVEQVHTIQYPSAFIVRQFLIVNRGSRENVLKSEQNAS